MLLTLVAQLPVVAFSAMLLGAGYGPNTPTGGQVLARVTPPPLRAMVFSIKQSGALIGGTLAGGMLPVVAAGYGWHAAIGLACLLTVAAAVAVEPLRRRLDSGSDENASPAARPVQVVAQKGGYSCC